MSILFFLMILIPVCLGQISVRTFKTLNIKASLYAQNETLLNQMITQVNRLGEQVTWPCFRKAGFFLNLSISDTNIANLDFNKAAFTNTCNITPARGNLKILGLDTFDPEKFGATIGLSNAFNCITYSILNDKCGLILLHEFLHTIFRIDHFEFSNSCRHVHAESNDTVNVMYPFYSESKCDTLTPNNTKMALKCTSIVIAPHYIEPIINHNPTQLTEWSDWMPTSHELFYNVALRKRTCKTVYCKPDTVLTEILVRSSRYFPREASLPTNLSGSCFRKIDKPTIEDGTIRRHTERLGDGVPCQNGYGTIGYCFDGICVKMGNDTNIKNNDGWPLNNLDQLRLINGSNTNYCKIGLPYSMSQNPDIIADRLNNDIYMPSGFKSIYFNNEEFEFVAYGTTHCLKLAEWLRYNKIVPRYVSGWRTHVNRLLQSNDPLYKRKCNPTMGFVL